jgi:hypothetical protein
VRGAPVRGQSGKGGGLRSLPQVEGNRPSPVRRGPEASWENQRLRDTPGFEALSRQQPGKAATRGHQCEGGPESAARLSASWRRTQGGGQPVICGRHTAERAKSAAPQKIQEKQSLRYHGKGGSRRKIKERKSAASRKISGAAENQGGKICGQ